MCIWDQINDLLFNTPSTDIMLNKIITVYWFKIRSPAFVKQTILASYQPGILYWKVIMHKKIDFRIGSKSQRSLETRIGRLYNFSTLDYIKLIKKKCFVFVLKRPFRGEKLHKDNYFVVTWQFIFYYSNLCNIKDHFCIFLPSTF